MRIGVNGYPANFIFCSGNLIFYFPKKIGIQIQFPGVRILIDAVPCQISRN